MRAYAKRRLLPAAGRIYTGKGEDIDHAEVLRVAHPG